MGDHIEKGDEPRRRCLTLVACELHKFALFRHTYGFMSTLWYDVICTHW